MIPKENKMTQVELQQAKERFLELVELAAGGEEIIISKDRQPFVKLSRVHGHKDQRRFGSAKGLITMAKEFDEPLEDFKEYM
jgi:antitoxin (DNA-binding transcriptional repressor) of toxin-antitoxin stability system